MVRRQLFTSESVSEGHPDKVADQISDAILDAILKEDPTARVACETMVSTGMVVISGEITTSTYVDFTAVARKTIKEIGYTDPNIGFDSENCAVLVSVDGQSDDIAMGVDDHRGDHVEQGAGDQGLMFGFACNETDALMPAPLHFSHKLIYELAQMRKTGGVSWLRPDSKSQVTCAYEGDQLVGIDAVVISTQHTEEVELEEIRTFIKEELILKHLPAELMSDDTKIYVNPTGRFVIGGPKGDCGLTGRKIIVDTYGGMGRHGGGAFSGKDPSKVDRSAAYMARYIAKNIVAAGVADRCEVQLAYAIGVADPVSVYVDDFGAGRVDPETLEAKVRELFELTPRGIIESLGLLRPIYGVTAAHGHFGREAKEGFFTWEKTDKAEQLKSLLS